MAYVWSYVVLIAVFIYLLIVFVFSCVTFLFFDATETVQRTTYEKIMCTWTAPSSGSKGELQQHISQQQLVYLQCCILTTPAAAMHQCQFYLTALLLITVKNTVSYSVYDNRVKVWNKPRHFPTLNVPVSKPYHNIQSKNQTMKKCKVATHPWLTTILAVEARLLDLLPIH